MRSTTSTLLLATSLAAVAPPGLCLAGEVLRAVEPATIDLRTAALIVSGQEGGTIPMAVLVVPAPEPAAAATAAVLIEIDGPGFVAEVLSGAKPAAPVDVEVFVYALRHQTEVVDQLARRVTLDWTRQRQLESTGVQLLAPLRLPPGDYTVRVLARRGEALGLRGARLSLPGDGDQPSLGPPLFADDEDWSVMLLDEGAVLPPPFGLGGEAVLPRGFPALVPGGTAEARVAVRRPPHGRWQLQAQWEAAGGVELAAQLPVEIVEESSRSGQVAARISTVAPELAEGRYRLRLRLEAEELQGREIVSDPVYVFVDASPAIADEAAASAEPLKLPSGPGSGPRSGPEKAEREIRARYLEALDLLAADDRDAALAALRSLESAAVEAFAESGLSALELIESRLFLGWPDDAWAAVLPVAVFHADAARQYHRSRRNDLMVHAVRMAVVLASSYAAELETAAAEREAAWLLAGLAGYFAGSGSEKRAAELLEAAAGLRGDDEGTLLGLACLHEKYGRFAAAVEVLRGLVAARPDHPEGRLRLALNLARTGSGDEARRLLRELRRDPSAADWIAVLAHQEEARMLADGGDLREAERIVRAALRRWPGQPTLTIQLAYLLDAGGDLQAARELLATVDDGERGGPAERSLYNRWPDAALAAGRLEVAERARGRLSDLAAALADLGGRRR
jgi:predicted Zn-dependent protease